MLGAVLEDDEDLDLERAAFDAERGGFDLLRAAALLPRIEGREPDVDAVTEAVDEWAGAVKDDLERRSSWQGPLHSLVSVLFQHARLRGDRDEFDAPRNSFLDQVVENRRGLPISLSLLVVETARRAGLVACGLSLPRHFMAGLMLKRAADEDSADLFFIDAFHAQVLPAEDVAARIGLPLEELPEHLSPATPECVLVRMLTNLRVSYLHRQDAFCCMRVLSRLLLLRPREAALHLERAHLKSALGDPAGALADAETGLRLARDPDEQDAAERILDKLTRTAGWIQ